MKKIWLYMVALLLISGCATPIPISETIPVYSGKPPATIAVAVADDRPFIVNDNKEEWFEGIMRAAFGIPVSHGRSLDPDTKPFALYLATKIKEALEKAGGKANVVQVPKGSSISKVVKLVHASHPGAALVVMMYQSRYDVAVFNPNYAYNFELIIIGLDGNPIGQKIFKKQVNDMELSAKYNLFDMMAETYKKNLDIFLNDPVIKYALDKAASAGS